jgi:hypothetical protein
MESQVFINAARKNSRKIPRVLFVLTAVIHSSSLESIPILFARKDLPVVLMGPGPAVSAMARPFHAEETSLRILKVKFVSLLLEVGAAIRISSRCVSLAPLDAVLVALGHAQMETLEPTNVMKRYSRETPKVRFATVAILFSSPERTATPSALRDPRAALMVLGRAALAMGKHSLAQV